MYICPFSDTEVNWHRKIHVYIMKQFYALVHGVGGQHSCCFGLCFFSGNDFYLLSPEPRNCLGEHDLPYAKIVRDLKTQRCERESFNGL